MSLADKREGACARSKTRPEMADFGERPSGFCGVGCMEYVPMELGVEPALCTDAEEAVKRERSVHNRAALTVDELVESRVRNTERFRELGLRNRRRLQGFPPEEFRGEAAFTVCRYPEHCV